MHYPFMPRFTKTKEILAERKKESRFRHMKKVHREMLEDKFCFSNLLFAFFISIAAVWFWNAIKKPVYQRLYAYNAPYYPNVLQGEQFVDVENDVVEAAMEGYNLHIKFKKFYTVSGRIVYIDRYNAVGTWFRAPAYQDTETYDTVVPLDLSVVHGKTALTADLGLFSHEYRLLLVKFSPDIAMKEVNNNHTIPATENIEKGLEILRTGDVVYMEGYLVDWKEKNSDKYIETATYPGEISRIKAGGRETALCRQFYLTKLVFDDYVFE